MLGTRIIAGFSMIAITAVILTLDQWLAPWFPFWLILSVLVTTLAARELADLMRATDVAPSRNTVVAVLVVVLANWIPHLARHTIDDGKFDVLGTSPGEPLSAFAWILITYTGVVMTSFMVHGIPFERPGRTVARIAGTIFAVSYIALLGSFIIQMRWLDGRGNGLLPLVYLISTAKGADIGAYLTGRYAGRHKLWPRLSPNKTIEGAIGGLVFSVAASLLISGFVWRQFALAGLGPVSAVCFGLLIGVVAQVGDLMESMIKRDCRRKDASSAVPGFGGVLDVMDSLLFAGPVAYLFWLWVGP